MIAVGQRVEAEEEWQAGGTVRPARRSAHTVASPAQEAAARRDVLARAIQIDVIPRLLAARSRLAPRLVSEVAMMGPVAADIDELATIALARDVKPAVAFVESVRRRGSSLESVFLELLAPTARSLGEMWEQDRAGFAEVTLGLTTLHQVLREFGPAFQSEAAATGRELTALLAPTPGEQHNFGLAIVAEFFRRAGWQVRGEAMTTRAELVATARRTWFPVIGLSLASEVRLEALADTIHAVRRASRNRAVGIMVGGPLFVAHPDLVRAVGADATAVDGKHAVLQATSLLPASVLRI